MNKKLIYMLVPAAAYWYISYAVQVNIGKL